MSQADQTQLALPLGDPVLGRAALVTRDDGTREVLGDDESWARWVPAGALRNWCRQDEILDWLDRYGSERGFLRDDQRPGYDERFDFTRYVIEQGRRFEQALLAHLERQLPVRRIATRDEGTRSLEAAEETWQAMAAGVQVISQGVLRDPQARVYGRADLLVRSDALTLLSPSVLDPEDDPTRPAPALDGAPWHYRVVEVKFARLDLLKTGALSTSSDLVPMTQAWSYNQALGRIQGLTPPYAYVLGRSWKQGKESGDGCLERLGRVPHDAYVKRLERSLGDTVAAGSAWIRRVRTEGPGWRVLPVPSIPELWPNMNTDRDAPWHEAKKEIAAAVGELTQLRSVGVAHRRTAHAAGVTRCDDPRLSAALLGVAGERNPELVDAILSVMRDGAVEVIPARIAADQEDWRQPRRLELYVDFETVNGLDDDFAAFPTRSGQSIIFQIGCGRYDDGRWEFRQFTASDLTVEAEGQMIDDWIAHLRTLARDADARMPDDVRVFHWSAAEPSSFDHPLASARTRHPGRDWPEVSWYDLLQRLVRAEPVVVRGATAFGLKSVARALRALGRIETEWGDGLADGTGAMVGAWRAAVEARRLGIPLGEVPLMQDVHRYNEIDCRVMAEVLRYLREKH